MGTFNDPCNTPCIWGVGSNPEFGIVAKYSTMTMTMTMAQYSDKYVFSFEKKGMKSINI
jgi:hypothetical protein